MRPGSDIFTDWRMGLIFSLFYLESRSVRLFFCFSKGNSKNCGD
ncbi:hypothetical protein J2Z31_003849 [Sinorhizobium kostiense]|uniref:Uncharacterized protein n=1 Tax=Sinorhizobium kostiense TaxID=76747 RepID=A0ABS4R377_9HYPH|nr:hypothetical protein [Sinorhizobium kostiense]